MTITEDIFRVHPMNKPDCRATKSNRPKFLKQSVIHMTVRLGRALWVSSSYRKLRLRLVDEKRSHLVPEITS